MLAVVSPVDHFIPDVRSEVIVTEEPAQMVVLLAVITGVGQMIRLPGGAETAGVFTPLALMLVSSASSTWLLPADAGTSYTSQK